MTAVVVLPVRLDANAARQLAADLLGFRSKPLIINAEKVEILSAVALEVIVSAALQWKRDGSSIEVVNGSDSYRESCRTLGLDPDQPWISSIGMTTGK